MFIAEVFERCEILTEEGDRRVVDAEYIKFGYDDTVFHHRRDVVLSATFQLTKADPARGESRRGESAGERQRRQGHVASPR